MSATPAGRTVVVWVPDWPIVALTRDGDDPLDTSAPVAVFEKGAVVACSAAARGEGVRRGLRRRDAQARCPQLIVVEADPVRDHRAFAPVIAAVEEQAPGVQLIHPGLVALHAKGPSRFYGGEAAAATVLAGAVAACGVADVRVGIADGTFTAEQAARVGTGPGDPVRIVPAGQAAPFLAPLSAVVLDGEGPSLSSLLGRLGVQTLGQVAALGADRLTERFGAPGMRLHALASGNDPRPVAVRTPPPELHREVVFEPPVELGEQVAFGMRVPAEEFTERLGARDLVCTELRVVLTGERGDRSDRVWLHPGAFDAAAIVDRVRWQLAEQGLRSAVASVRIEPEGVDAAAHHTARLFGSGPEERVHHALSRVQAMLGHQGVLTPEIGDGRWLGERQQLVPWGDRRRDGRAEARGGARGQARAGASGGARRGGRVARAAEPPWPGRLPGPLPTTVFTPSLPVAVLDGDGDMVAVDARGELTATPARLVAGGRERGIRRWAGPWPVIERGWDAVRARHAHRFQLVDTDEAAWLLVCEEGVWHAEGVYD
ncbi:MAG: nucleotidyltransferase [Microbacterium sp. SCN 70-27]|mgnify:CR=1 FL=1|uniref:Y-family DNA polymerase n=1 Tax=unclassified Microbacterium TaxID=2609290 RepID=UPI00086A41DE|nr:MULTISPECIES: DNA polymerase Y family protein [unclassified Microbacterium]MBN9224142.1 DNA polymerase Y family protein [Microbacterium sp.]ODT26664.1 MAG: nucleotidyltransferase [Microbacterium sp. SCN 70-27]